MKDRQHNGQDTKGVIRIRKSMKDRQHNGQDTKGVIRICKSMKDRQHNGQKKKDKQWSTKYTHKTKDCVARTPLKTGSELRCTKRVSCSCSSSGTRRKFVVSEKSFIFIFQYYRYTISSGILSTWIYSFRESYLSIFQYGSMIKLCNGTSMKYFNQVFCQMVHWFQRMIILNIFPTGSYYKKKHCPLVEFQSTTKI
jgi:hypothetical protein